MRARLSDLSTLIRIKTLTPYISATGLGVLAGLAAYACWHAAILPDLTSVFPGDAPANLNPPDSTTAAIALTGYALAVSLPVNRFGLSRSWRYVLTTVVVLLSLGITGFQFFGLDLLTIPLLFSGSLSLLLIQVNRFVVSRSAVGPDVTQLSSTDRRQLRRRRKRSSDERTQASEHCPAVD